MPTTLTERLGQSVHRLVRDTEGSHATPAPPSDQVMHPEDILLRNSTDEEIPAYGCVKVTGAEEDSATGRYVLIVAKPDGTGGPFLFNGPRSIEEGGTGAIPPSPVVKAAYSSGTPAAGETWGPASDWVVVKHGQPAILVYGPLKAGEFLIGNTDQRQLTRIGKVDSTIDVSVSTSGTGSIWSDGGDTTNNDTIDADWMNSDEDISATKEAVWHWFDDEGKFRVLGAGCE